MKVEMLADGLGWPEGPAPLPDGRILFVETYRSQVSIWRPGHAVEQFAYVGGGPNAVLAAADGYSYVTQNGGVIGPWRATDKRPPSIQRITPAGKVEVPVTEVAGHTLRAPNDLRSDRTDGCTSPIPAARSTPWIAPPPRASSPSIPVEPAN